MKTISVLLVLLVLAPLVPAQLKSQTLPTGYMNVEGDSGTSSPFDVTADQIWQWHYDATEFLAGGEVSIREISIRADGSTSNVAGFFFNTFEVTLIEASTDHRAVGHLPVFDDNVLRSQVVRTGGWASPPITGSGGVTADWIRFDLATSFSYDPTTGNDLIIQVRTCNVSTPFAAQIDGVSGAAIGGNRYGHTSNCNALAEITRDNEFVPVVKIDYVEVQSRTLPAGFENSPGNTGTSNPFATTASQAWQWHYDSSEFNVSGPIAITELFVRAHSTSATVQAFNFAFLEVTLIEASTDYGTASHQANFAANVFSSRVVRTGAWIGGPVKPSGGATSLWIPLELQDSFLYDPATGRDLIVQLRTCTPVNDWGVTMDGVIGSPGTIGGNRYGNLSVCQAASANFNNDEFVPIVKMNFIPATVAGYPYREDFSSAAGSAPPAPWSQGRLDVGDWTFRSDQTPSTGTGPTADHTSRVPGEGTYAYVEDSGSEVVAIDLLTPWFDLSALSFPMMTFWFHSHDAQGGANSNRVDIDVILQPSGTVLSNLVPAVVHSPLNDWEQVVFNLGSFAGQTVQFRFRGRTDNGAFTHDIAIDDFRLFDAVVTTGQGPQPGSSVLDVGESFNANGLGTASAAPGPYFSEAPVAELLSIRVGGPPGQPIILFTGPLNVGAIDLAAVGQLDLGFPGPGGTLLGLDLLADGTRPTFPDVAFRTDAFGDFEFALFVPVQLVGFTFGLQAIVFGTPTVLSFGNAVETVIVP